MKIKSFEFNMREFAGSMGDFGTLLPLAIGYMAVCGLNPTGMLVMMGVANVATGLVYRLPMPIEPMKVIAVVAIAQHWSPSMIYASGFAMGVVWLLLAVTGVVGLVARVTPSSVIRGIQIALGVLLAIEAFKMLSTWWILGIACVVIAILFRQNRYAPSAFLLVAVGVTVMVVKGHLRQAVSPTFSMPPITTFRLEEVWQTLLLAGFSQIPLTVTNATISTSSLLKQYWPDADIGEKKLSWSQGAMNMAGCFFGAMPMCHGAGGLAGQYYFGARTGGANIIEGLMEISLGLFFAGSIAGLFANFPKAIIGAMMLLVGIELTKFAKGVRLGKEAFPMAATLVVSLVTNMAFGFLAGLACHYVYQFGHKRMGRA